MQLIALDEQNQRILAHEAQKPLCYKCPECNAPVRVRGGPFRRLHYYHSARSNRCNQSGKSLEHLAIQLFIQQNLPSGEGELEVFFKTIRRIADVAWHQKKLIFEIQCSPISPEEIEARNQDYASLGYQVIWILHENRYNRPQLSPVEKYLFTSPYYFTNINKQGKGMIYDQLYQYNGLKKVWLTKRLPLQITTPQKIPTYQTPPSPISHRLTTWPLCMPGDAVTLFLQGKLQLSTKDSFLQKIGRIYLAFFYRLLERL